MIRYKMYNDYTFNDISRLIKKLNLLTQSDSQVSAHNYLKHVLRNLFRFNIKHRPYHLLVDQPTHDKFKINLNYNNICLIKTQN